MERREELLRAAARVYAQHGYRGSTTRRIADEAGVNEITIFRQFGTKDALIHEAIATCGATEAPVRLPAEPQDPVGELTSWALRARAHISSRRMLLRRCMSEREEHPQLIDSANRGPINAARDLRAYLLRLRALGVAAADFDADAATSMLMGSVFADAMGRDHMREVYVGTPNGAVEEYVRLLLRGIGVALPPAHRAASDAASEAASDAASSRAHHARA